MVTKTTHTIAAHWPRENEYSTVSPDDRLQLVFSLYAADTVGGQRTGHPPKHTDSADYPDNVLNLVFVHGTQMCKEVWDYMVEKFYTCEAFGFGARLGTVVAVDPVNHGESAVLNSGKLGPVCTWYDGGKDIVQILRHLNVTRGTTMVLGHSMGGAQAVYAALFEPHLIDSVVLFDPVGYFDGELFDNEHVVQLTGKRMTKLKRFVRAEFADGADYEKYMKTVGISRTFHPRIQADYIRYAARQNADGSYSFNAPAQQQLVSYLSSQFAMRDIRHLLPAVKPAMLHVGGSLADWNPPEAQDMWTSLVPRSEAVEVPNGTHLFPFDLPDETFDTILPFITKRLEQGTLNSRRVSARRVSTDAQRRAFVDDNIDNFLQGLTKGKRELFSKL